MANLGPLHVLPNKFVVRPLEDDRNVLIGIPVATEMESTGSDSLSFVTFCGSQQAEWAYDATTNSFVEVLRVEATFAGVIIPPLAASLMSRPCMTSSFFVRTDRLLYLKDPAALMDTVPSIQRRSLYIRFCEAHLSVPHLLSFLNNTLRGWNPIERIDFVDLGRGAIVLLKNSSAAEPLLSPSPTGEVFCNVAGKSLYVCNYKYWLDMADQRRLYLTFTGVDDEVTEGDLRAYFNHQWPVLESVQFECVKADQKPRHAYAYFFASAPVRTHSNTNQHSS